MKRVTLMALALVMVLGLILTGCGGGTDNSATPAPTTAGATQAAATTPPAETAEPTDGKFWSDPGVFPITQELYDLTIMRPQSGMITAWEYGENKLTTHMQDLTNIRVVWNLLPETGYEEKVSLTLASGAEMPDAFQGCNFTNAMQAKYGEEGIIIPLEDLMDTEGSEVLKLFEAIPTARARIAAPDGHIYGWPSYGRCFNCDYAMRAWICKDFMEATGITEDPQTTEELYTYLKAVKDMDANGNGDANDEIPFSGGQTGWYHKPDGWVMGSFIYNSYYNYQLMDGDKVEVAFNKPEWREGLKYLNRLYAEGLLDPASLTQDGSQLQQVVEDGSEPRVGFVTSGSTAAFANPSGDRRRHYKILPPVEGPAGVRLSRYDAYAGVSSTGFVISKDCEVPEIAVKFADCMLTEDISLWNRYGEPGVDWVVPEGKEAVRGGPAMYREILLWAATNSSHWAGVAPIWNRFGSDGREKEDDEYELEYILYWAAKAYEPYNADGIYTVPPLFYTAEEATEIGELEKVFTDYCNEYKAQFITGDLNVNDDAVWQSYLDAMEGMGLDRYLAVLQSAYDRQWKK